MKNLLSGSLMFLALVCVLVAMDFPCFITPAIAAMATANLIDDIDEA